jgi:glycosyltransferase involved in cell wall biosynthesis
MRLQNLYIDYTGSIPTKANKFHGGNNYTKRILLFLARSNITRQVIILWPANYNTENKEEKEIRNSSNFQIVEIKNLNSDIHFENDSAIFFPLLKVRQWPVIKKIKQKYPGLKVYITIHGLRLIDLNPDAFDRYYNKHLFLPSLQHSIKSVLYKHYLKKYLPLFDKVFTVSNHSLQQVVKYSSINYINYFYQGVNQRKSKITSKIEDDFILFVSANRLEKNFIRAIKAFCGFKSQTNNHIYLYVTGINESFKTKILKSFNESDRKHIERWTKFYDYVESDFLCDLYSQCKFFLYTSRSEGFGLPVMEAVFHGKAVVASYKTSIPEVAGSTIYYVDPLSISSIARGITYMSNIDNLREHERRISKTLPIIHERIKVDQENLLYEILN